MAKYGQIDQLMVYQIMGIFPKDRNLIGYWFINSDFVINILMNKHLVCP